VTEFHRFFKELSKGLFLLLLIFAPLLFFNIVIDPYGVFLNINKKSRIEPNLRYLKMRHILQNPHKFNSFIFGSSRVNFIDPVKIPGESYYNMSYSNGVPKDHLEDITLMVKNGVKIKNLLIGIDYLSLMENPQIDEKDLLRRPYPESVQKKISFYTSYLFFRPDWKVLKLAVANYGIDRSKQLFNGIIANYKNDSLIKKNPEAYIKANRFLIPYTHYAYNSDIRGALYEIEKLVQFAKKNQIKVIFFINPTHHISYLNINLDDYFEALKRLIDITEFYDFSGLNSIATDNINYNETSHYRFYTGDLIVARIFKNSKIRVPDDFGHYITKPDIDKLISLHQSLLNDYFKVSKIKVSYSAPMKGSADYCIDYINGINSAEFNTLYSFNHYLNLTGWAIDKLNHGISGGILVLLDGKEYQSQCIFERPDLVNHFHNEQFGYAGWGITIPTDSLSEGMHELTFKVLNRRQTGCYISNNKIPFEFIRETSNPLEGVSLSDKRTKYAIDEINGIVLNKARTPMVINNNRIRITGWAVDFPGKKPASAVLVEIDGKMIKAAYGANRSDVAEYLNDTIYRHSGWSITFPASYIHRGWHKLTFKIITNDRKLYFNTGECIVFKTI